MNGGDLDDAKHRGTAVNMGAELVTNIARVCYDSIRRYSALTSDEKEPTTNIQREGNEEEQTTETKGEASTPHIERPRHLPHHREGRTIEAFLSVVGITLVTTPNLVRYMRTCISFGLSREQSCIIRMVLHDVVL